MYETLLEIAKKASVFGYLKLYLLGTWKKDEDLQLKLHHLRFAAINIQIVKKNKKQFQFSSN